MNTPKINISFTTVFNYLLKTIAPILVVVGVCGSAYWDFYIEPRIERRLKPLTIFILETNLLVRKMAPDSIKRSVDDELKSYYKYISTRMTISP